MSSRSSDQRVVDPELFRDVIGRFATGVTVVTAADEDRPYGTTASAVSSLSLEPPSLLVCMNRGSETAAAIDREGTFVVNVLHEGQGELAARFARKGGDKFEGLAPIDGVHGDPLLEDALAHLQCRVVERTVAGTHTIFIAEVTEAAGTAGMPLAYFRGAFGRLHLPDQSLSKNQQ